MTIKQLNPPIPLSTPKGDGLAWLVIDYGIEHDLMWVVAIDETDEIWTFANQKVRAQKNITMGRLHSSYREKLDNSSIDQDSELNLDSGLNGSKLKSCLVCEKKHSELNEWCFGCQRQRDLFIKLGGMIDSK